MIVTTPGRRLIQPALVSMVTRLDDIVNSRQRNLNQQWFYYKCRRSPTELIVLILVSGIKEIRDNLDRFSEIPFDDKLLDF